METHTHTHTKNPNSQRNPRADLLQNGLVGSPCSQTEIICPSSVKNTIGSLISIALNMYITLNSIVILTVLILPVQEHGIYFPLFVSSLISFISVLQFSQCRSFASLGRFIPRCFVFFFLFNVM